MENVDDIAARYAPYDIELVFGKQGPAVQAWYAPTSRTTPFAIRADAGGRQLRGVTFTGEESPPHSSEDHIRNADSMIAWRH